MGFLTLTSKPGTEWATITRGWNNLLKWLRRRQPNLQYCAVKEEGALTGMKHLHVIAYPWIWVDQRALSDEWDALTGSRITHVRRVGNHEKTASYVSKYVSKSIANLRKGVTWSKGWPKLPKEFHFTYLGPCAYPGNGTWLTSGALQESGPDCGCHGVKGKAPWASVKAAAPWLRPLASFAYT